jgi:hypothetical protein
VIARLLEAGMNVARLNFSHGSHAEHGARIAAIRKVAAGASCPSGYCRIFRPEDPYWQPGRSLQLAKVRSRICMPRHRPQVGRARISPWTSGPSLIRSESDRLLLDDGRLAPGHFGTRERAHCQGCWSAGC